MKKIINIIMIVLAWSFSLINTSGLGLVYDTPTKTNIFIAIWFIIVHSNSTQKIPFFKNGWLVFFTFISFILLPLITASSWEGLSYLMMIPLVYCFSQQKVDERDFVLAGYIVAALGLFVLNVYSRTEILSGWNYNQISMIGLFSYIFYSISLYGNVKGRALTVGLIISVLYTLALTQNTDSRSGAIFISAAVLLAYRGDFIKKYLIKNKFVFWAFSVPLLIAIVFVLFPNLIIFQHFNEWSELNYGKSAFNGRDKLWLEAWHRLVASGFIGEGKFFMNHHNSAVAALCVFGIIGYICWYKMLVAPVKYMARFVNDNIVFGCLISFLLIYWQQSFELGFIAASPNMVPYTILGLGIARVNSINNYGYN